MQTVVTHSGSFDPDDVLAVAAVQLYLGEENTKVIRSRDMSVINEADWAVDVGGIYDVTTKRFDHHQNGVPMRENGVPYSAFGLIWREYGREIAGSPEAALEIEERLVQPIDAADNHISVCRQNHPEITPFLFFDVIDTFKPAWGSDETFDSGFVHALDFARNLLKRMIAQVKGHQIMGSFIKTTYSSAEEKEVLVFERPVARNVFTGFEEVKVVVSPVHATDVGGWMAATVPEDLHEFKNRAAFPDAWAGLVDEELVAVSGIDGAVFCHKDRYVFVAKTKEAALAAAWEAVRKLEEIV